MSDYHRIYMKLADLCERGHSVQVEKSGSTWEVTVYAMLGPDHDHTNGELLSETMDRAHRKALAAWPDDALSNGEDE